MSCEHSYPTPPAAPRIALNILVVEDDLALLKLYEIVLGSWQLAPVLTVAGNGAAAIAALASTRPDILILDLNLPDLDGFAMVRKLLADNRFQALTIVVVSGMSHKDLQERGGLPAGVVFMRKPIQFLKLLAIAEVLDLAKNPAEPTPSPQAPAVASDAHGMYRLIDPQLVRTTIGDMATFDLVAAIFLDQLVGWRAELSCAKTPFDRKNLHALIHKMKGSCKTIAAIGIAWELEQLERELPKLSTQDWSVRYLALDAHLVQLQAEIETIIAR